MDDMAVAILVPLGFFATIAAISIYAILAGQRARRDLHETMRRALDTGQVLSPETISALHKPARSREQDLRSGVILTSLGVGLGLCAGLAATGALFDDPHDAGGFMLAAVIVGSIGLGQLVAALVRRRSADGA
jgi:hypothetical protein